MAVALRWGTWEELVLGGAVLRHGTEAWDAVASEVRSRSSFPHLFTPQECHAKYEDLQERYSGCDAWFEELRKQRVAELKRELERSEDSIGSLQSKLESLTSERESNSNFGYNTSRMESTSPTEDADGIDSSREVSKDGSSAGSFTEKTGRDWSPGCQILASVSSQENNHKMQSSEDSVKEKAGCECLVIGFGSFKRKRGKRKRKGCNVVEGSVGDSDTLSSAAFKDREGSSEACNQDAKVPSEDPGGILRGEDDTHLDLAGIMDSIMDQKDVSIFQRRLESQKRARYKKVIRRHVDFQNISLKIGDGSISSAKELFRDLLLLSNNAFVFYPKNSPEHKSALILRDLVKETLRHHSSSQNPTRSSGHHGGAVSIEVGKPKKLQSVKPCDRNVSKDAVVASKGDGSPVTESGKKGSRADVALVSPGRRRDVGRPVKGGQRGGRRRQEIPNKGRKRARR